MARGKIKLSVVRRIRSLSKLAEVNDEHTWNHTLRINLYSRLLARRLGQPAPFCAQIGPMAPMHDLRQVLLKLDEDLNGNRSKQQVGEKRNPTINTRLFAAMSGTMYSTYGPTPTHRRSLEIANIRFGEFKTALEDIIGEKLPELEKALQDAGAPWVKGQPIPEY